ncbi:putative purine permease 11 [Quercus suber]|uniref:Purine permease 11 n=1 Tax=Quercus suber TaxID=58331 RepID=A0AAW0JME6_QUESU
MTDHQEPMIKNGTLSNQSLIGKLNRWQWWNFGGAKHFFLIVGQAAAVLLGRVSKWQRVIGFLCTLGASALYSLLLSLKQLSFQKVIKKETFSVVLEMQIYTALVATCVSVVGLFASGEWKTLHGEMVAFSAGRVSYVILGLDSGGLAGLFCRCCGINFVVSSLFSNVISTASLAITPVASVIVFRDKMNGIKVIALLLAIWVLYLIFTRIILMIVRQGEPRTMIVNLKLALYFDGLDFEIS